MHKGDGQAESSLAAIDALVSTGLDGVEAHVTDRAEHVLRLHERSAILRADESSPGAYIVELTSQVSYLDPPAELIAQMIVNHLASKHQLDI